uniref:NTF2 domain-containing protein n=1 Tax=Meloidogyne javanica TaxID=6303 RepID=A0A915M4Y0_MELJA
MAYNTNFDQVGQAFIAHYYSKFDVPDVAARTAGLTDLYDADLSFMTFEGTPTDCQPLPDGSILVTVIGQLKTDDDPVNSFNHCFVLKPNTTGSFYISNEIFRLILH